MPLLRRALAAALVAASLPVAAVTAAPGPQPSAVHTIPFASGAVDPAVDWAARDPSGAERDLVLVQFAAFPVRAGLVDAVAATGARLVQPLAPVSYVVWADAAQAVAIRGIDGVRWAGVLPPAARLAPSVTAETNKLRVTFVDAAAAAGLAVESAYTTPRAFTSLDGAVALVPGGADLARRLSGRPGVYSVADGGDDPQLRDEKGAQVVARGTTAPLAPGYRSFLTKHGVTGAGVVVSHVDGGVDYNHPELTDRVKECTGYGTDGPVLCAARNHDDAVGHGTHTLGIVLGTGSTGLGDIDGFDYGLGVAPGAQAIVQNAIHTGRVGTSPFANGYRPPYADASRKGAIVSQNSWGPSGTPKGYDAVTREFDSMVRDVDDAVPGDQAMALVFSVMNGRGGTSTQGTPDEGKNLIGVGGTGLRAATGGTSPGVDDLCTCTAHGPALDGRLLPTLVAPAQLVMSTRATQGTLCGLAGAASELPSPLHASCTGTSMASPHVSGAYALFVEWFRKHHGGATPSPALVKAALVNQTDDLKGKKDADGGIMTAIPNNKQGWGRLNIGKVLDAWTAGVTHVDQSTVFDGTGESFTTTVTRAAGAPLKVTLAWTDALGPGLGGKTPAWVNDLDLFVTAPDGTVYRGNVFGNGASVAGGSSDRKNNLENVFLADAGPGTYTVRVAATNLLGDGLPNRNGDTDQDFALVIAA